MNLNSVEHAVAILVSGLLGCITLYFGFHGRDLNVPSMVFALWILLPSAVARANLSYRSPLLRATLTAAGAAWTMAFLLTWFTLKEMSLVEGTVNLVISILGFTACFLLQNHPGFAGAPYPLLVREILEPPLHRQISRCRGGG